MSRRAFLWFAATCTLFAADTGIRPRGTPSEYPAYQTTSGITLAAAVLTPEQVHKRFATDLNRGYVVVEVAVYPEAGRDVTLAARDFLLRFASDPATERPLSAQTIAAKLGPKDDREPKVPSRVQVYQGTTIGYEHGPYGRSGVYTGTEVGVGVGGPGTVGAPPHPNRMDRTAIQQELESGALPDGRTTQEIAGYLYFSKPSAKGKLTAYQLTYFGADGQIRLTVPIAK